MKYKLGINLDLGFQEDEKEILIEAKKAGFEAFFFLWSRGKSEKCREVAALAKQENMIFQSIHAPWVGFNKLWEEQSAATERVVDEAIECVKLCAELNVPLMVIHPYVGFNEPKITPFGELNFGKIVKVAEELGVDLAFENVEGEPYLAEIFRVFGNSPRVGLCWDTGHEQCYNFGRDIPGLYANGKLFGVHFNDSLGITDRNNVTWLDDVHLLPYDGTNDWRNIMQRLQKAGFSREILMFELTRTNKPDRHTHDKYADWSLREFMQNAYARAKKVAEEQI